MVKTKEEHLVELKRKVEEAEMLKNHKVMGVKLLYAAGLLIAAGIIASAGTVISSSSAQNVYQAVADGEPVRYEFLNYENTFIKWNSTIPGNDVNVLLSGGKICQKDGMTATAIKIKQGQTVVIPGASYLNKQGNEFIYRDDHTRKVVAFDPISQKKRIVFDGNAGEVMCEGSYVYFVNYGANSHIYRLKLEEESTPEEIISKSVQSFASIGDSILYLTTDGNLYVQQYGKKGDCLICDHVERFFVAGRIFVESQDKIIDFTPLGKNARLIYQGISPDMRMVGVGDSCIYIQENGELYRLEAGEKYALIDAPHSLYGSISLNKEGTGLVYEQFRDETGYINEAVAPVLKEVK